MSSISNFNITRKHLIKKPGQCKILLTLSLITLINIEASGQQSYIINSGNPDDLASILDIAIAGDTILVTGNYDLDQLSSTYSLPLIIPQGVILEGDYDLLSQPSPNHPVTSPDGTLIFSNTYRAQFDLFCSGTVSEMFYFAMEPGKIDTIPCAQNCSTIFRNIRLRGASLNWQEFNDGYSTPYSLCLWEPCCSI
jgi:hypothetical protein